MDFVHLVDSRFRYWECRSPPGGLSISTGGEPISSCGNLGLGRVVGLPRGEFEDLFGRVDVVAIDHKFLPWLVRELQMIAFGVIKPASTRPAKCL